MGAWLCSHEYLAHLVRRGHHVDVFVRLDRSAPVDEFEGVRVGPSSNAHAMAAAVAMSDVVVSHLGDINRAADLAARYGKPNVRMAHGRIDDPAVLEGAALVVFNSRNLASSVDCPAPAIVCRPPVFAERFATVPGDRVTLINLSEAKGGELFWRLVHCSPRKFLGVHGGYGVQYLGQAANAEVVTMTENMRDDVYGRTRVLLMPSERETWGMTGVEAMASGIPVIAHPTEGLVESLGDAGVFVDRADGQGWLDAIERLHDSDEWAAASALALARSAELDPTDDLNRFATAIEQLHCTGGNP